MPYNVSDMYKEAIKASVRKTFIDGEIITTSGQVITIDNHIIVPGSFYYTNQITEGDNFSFSSVYAAEMGITIRPGIDRHLLFNAVVKPYFNILLRNSTYERIPLGVYTIVDPSRSGRNIRIMALDGMLALDQDVVESTTGNAFEMLSLAADRCGLKLAQTRTELEGFPNGNIQLTLDQTRVDTYRDLVYYIACVLCSFAVMDRSGKLRLCQFSRKNSNTIDGKYRTSSTFSDFESYYRAVRVRFLESGKLHEYHAEDETSDGLVYEMGDIPIVQGLPETNQQVIDTIFSIIRTVKYTPMSIRMPGDPSIELGDLITNMDRNGNRFESLVTSYRFSYRGSMQLKSAGRNPKLAGIRDKSAKILANLEQEISAKSIHLYKHTNISNIRFTGGGITTQEMRRIIQMPFAALIDTSTMFIATIPFEMSVDGIIEMSIYLDGIHLDNSNVKKYCNKGADVITMMNYIDVARGRRYVLEVFAKTYYELDSDIRMNTARIATNDNAITTIIEVLKGNSGTIKDALDNGFAEVRTKHNGNMQTIMSANQFPVTGLDNIETSSFDLLDVNYITVTPDKTTPTATIASRAIKAVVMGQGMAGRERWDGTIVMHEVMGGVIPVAAVKARNDYTAKMEVGTIADGLRIFTEKMGGAVPIIGVKARGAFKEAFVFATREAPVPPAGATASSQSGTANSASMAIDTLANTFWSSANNQQNNSWLQVTYANEFTVKGYSIIASGNLNSMPNSFELQGFDGTNWVILDARTQTHWIVGGEADYIVMTTDKYNRYRLFIITTNGAITANIAELKLYSDDYAPPGGAKKLTLFNPTSNNVNAHLVPARAIDGDVNTMFATLVPAPHWLDVHTEIATVTKYVMFAPTDGNHPNMPMDFSLQAFVGNNWVDIDNRSGIIFANSERKEFNVPNNTVKASRYRLFITMTGNQNRFGIALNEFELYGTISN